MHFLYQNLSRLKLFFEWTAHIIQKVKVSNKQMQIAPRVSHSAWNDRRLVSTTAKPMHTYSPIMPCMHFPLLHLHTFSPGSRRLAFSPWISRKKEVAKWHVPCSPGIFRARPVSWCYRLAALFRRSALRMIYTRRAPRCRSARENHASSFTDKL